MPRKKNAAKAMRQSAKRYERNKELKRKIKDLRKKATKAVTDKKQEAAVAVYRELQQVVDKASKSGHFLNKNTGSRYKARLMKQINSLSAKK